VTCASFTRSRRLSAKRGTIGAVLWFWVVVLVVLIGAIAIVASGRGDSMVEVYDDRADASLPAGRPLNADDLRSVRLNTGVRGYRMDEVDALLARLEAEMLEREDHEEVRVVTAQGAASADLAEPDEADPDDAALDDAALDDAAPDDAALDDAALDDAAPDDAGLDQEDRRP